MAYKSTAGFRQRVSGTIASALLPTIARISKRTACSLSGWWNRQHMLHPNWCGECRARVFARTRVGLITCDLRDSVQQQLFLRGEWEPTISSTIRKILRPGDVFVDVGANIGYYSLLASHRVGNGGAVLAFEPLPDNVEQLVRNVRTNAAENIVVLSIALGQETRTVNLYAGAFGNVGWSSLRPVSACVARVVCCPLDALLGQELQARIRLVKVDVEGAELGVLMGMGSLLTQEHPPLVICEVTEGFLRELGHRASDLIGYMRGLGYRVYITPRQGAEEWEELGEECPPPAEQVDALFVPQTLEGPSGVE